MGHRDDEKKGTQQGDLLYTLLQAQDIEAGIGRMTDSQLRDEVMTIFLAGHETTANALTWTLYLLSKNPTVESKLYEELCSILGNNSNNGKDRIPTIEDIPKLEYTEKVFRESMRLYPPAWTIGRQVISDYRVDKYIIPAGSIILMSQYVMHRNPRYFSDPDSFNPDRWSKEMKSNLPRFSYFPFGGGIRGCVGEPLSLTGLGERSHLVSRDIGFDIIRVLKYENLSEVMLVGHSYGGFSYRRRGRKSS